MKYLQRFVYIEVYKDISSLRHIRVLNIRVLMFGFKLAHFYIEEGSLEIKRKRI